MKCSAPRVITGITCAPASTRRRQTSTALYAAIPPDTPSTIRLPASGLPPGDLAATAGLRVAWAGSGRGVGGCAVLLGQDRVAVLVVLDLGLGQPLGTDDL